VLSLVECLQSLFFKELPHRRCKSISYSNSRTKKFSHDHAFQQPLTLYGMLIHSTAVEADRDFPDTCQWILSHSNFEEWIRETNHLLWTKGKPGAGKSTVLALAYNYLKGKALVRSDPLVPGPRFYIDKVLTHKC
jgi:hypothetical protein